MEIRRLENLGPAERIVQTLLSWSDHLVHNRTGVVITDLNRPTGVTWQPAIWKEEKGRKVVYRMDKRTLTLLGPLQPDGRVGTPWTSVGRWQKAGLQPETAVYLYRQIADVFRMDNEFVARWASWAFARENRDLKVVLAAFLLVQPRAGLPTCEAGKVLFYDDDLRAVAEAMLLLTRKDGRDFNPKLLLRVGELLALPAIAAINVELGFARAARNPFLGRWPKVVEKWLAYRERNPKMLEGLVRAGFRTTVMKLAQKVGYKPQSPRFFEILRWKQKQAADGRRTLAIGANVAAAESWEHLKEAEICARIVQTRPDFKRIVGLLPPRVGLTRAVVVAAMEAGSLSNTDLVLLTPTLEDLGLLDLPAVRARWEAACKLVENQRTANIATRVRSEKTAETLQAAAEAATRKVVAEATRNLRVYFFVDISGSMDQAIVKAKDYLTRFLYAFPADRLHIAVFNTVGREVVLKHASAAGVSHAFASFKAGGGTDYGAGVRALAHHKPKADEDALFVFVGDQQAGWFADAVRQSGINPIGFAFLFVGQATLQNAVEGTAYELKLPCLRLDEAIFADPYAIAPTLRNLIASTPVKATTTAPPRQTLVQEILATELLKKPVWA